MPASSRNSTADTRTVIMKLVSSVSRCTVAPRMMTKLRYKKVLQRERKWSKLISMANWEYELHQHLRGAKRSQSAIWNIRRGCPQIAAHVDAGQHTSDGREEYAKHTEPRVIALVVGPQILGPVGAQPSDETVVCNPSDLNKIYFNIIQ